MKSVKKSKSDKVASEKRTKQDRVNAAMEELQSLGYRVWVRKEGEDAESIGDDIKQRAYYNMVAAAADSIIEDWRNGDILDEQTMCEMLDSAGDFAGGENEALDILRWTDNRGAYEENYGSESGDWNAQAAAAFRADIAERVSRKVDLNDPAPYTISCPKCGTRPCEDGDTECPKCGWEDLKDSKLFVVDSCVVCDSCFDEDDHGKVENATAMSPGEVAECIVCDEKFRVPK